MATLFVSDLHLDAERPAITDLFGRFLEDEARDPQGNLVFRSRASLVLRRG